MKKLLYLGILLMFGSCGSNEVVSNPINESDSSSSTVNVDGREVSTIKIDDLVVMTEDLGEMNWEEAKKACKNLGDGWRLPTKDELNILYHNKDKIGGYTLVNYWSSKMGDLSTSWIQNFDNGSQVGNLNSDTNSVRAVRSI